MNINHNYIKSDTPTLKGMEDRYQKKLKAPFSIAGYHVCILGESQTLDIQNLCERCRDYFILDQGTGPGGHVGTEILDAHLGQSEKYVIGLYEDETHLRAIVDLLQNYPKKNEWFLGLVLIDPEARGLGLGRLIHEGVLGWIKDQKGYKINIGVLDNNRRALKFWTRLGYVFEKESKLIRGGKETKSIVQMTYDLEE